MDDAGDHTRTIPPVRVPHDAVPDLPRADLPRPPRWPLWATDEPGAAQAARPSVDVVTTRASGPARPVVPWIAAAVVVALTAGTGGVLVAQARQPVVDPITVSLNDLSFLSPESEDQVAAGGAGDGRDAGSSRDAERDRRTPVRRDDARSMVDAATATAPDTAPPTVDTGGEPVTFAATNLLDGRPETAWRAPGAAQDTVLTVRLDRPTVVTTVGLLNGYAKTSSADGREIDWYDGNRRVRRVEWFFDDGSRVVQSLRDTPRVQRTDIRPTRTRTVRLRIAEVTEPGAGPDGRDFTALSKVVVEGVPTRGDRPRD